MDNKELSTNVEHESEFNIKNKIYFIRNQQVMMDNDLAVLYQVETGRLNETVKQMISFVGVSEQNPEV